MRIVNYGSEPERAFNASCRHTRPLVPMADGAVLGDDGRYHLSRNHRLGCQSLGRRGSLHAIWVGWWTDCEQYRLQVPRGEPFDDYTSFEVEWRVQASDDELLDPAMVAPRRRCPADREWWPGYLGGSGPLTDVRRALVSALGPTCSLCRASYPFALDHDHESGLVRGYLCRDCNSQVERCVHISGCPRAEYLNDPPALDLGLVPPKRVERRNRVDRRDAVAAALALVEQTRSDDT